MALSYEEQGNSFTALRDYMLSGNGNNNGTHNAKVVIEDSESHILSMKPSKYSPVSKQMTLL